MSARKQRKFIGYSLSMDYAKKNFPPLIPTGNPPFTTMYVYRSKSLPPVSERSPEHDEIGSALMPLGQRLKSRDNVNIPEYRNNEMTDSQESLGIEPLPSNPQMAQDKNTASSLNKEKAKSSEAVGDQNQLDGNQKKNNSKQNTALQNQFIENGQKRPQKKHEPACTSSPKLRHNTKMLADHHEINQFSRQAILSTSDRSGGDRPSRDRNGNSRRSQNRSGGVRLSRDRGGSARPSQDRSASGRRLGDRSGNGRRSQDRSGNGRRSQDRSGSGRRSQDRSGSGRCSQGHHQRKNYQRDRVHSDEHPGNPNQVYRYSRDRTESPEGRNRRRSYSRFARDGCSQDRNRGHRRFEDIGQRNNRSQEFDRQKNRSQNRSWYERSSGDRGQQHEIRYSRNHDHQDRSPPRNRGSSNLYPRDLNNSYNNKKQNDNTSTRAGRWVASRERGRRLNENQRLCGAMATIFRTMGARK